MHLPDVTLATGHAMPRDGKNEVNHILLYSALRGGKHHTGVDYAMCVYN